MCALSCAQKRQHAAILETLSTITRGSSLCRQLRSRRFTATPRHASRSSPMEVGGVFSRGVFSSSRLQSGLRDDSHAT